MDLSLIQARLKAMLIGLRTVGLVADLDAAFGGAVTTPSAFVLPLAETGEGIGVLGGAEQRLTHNFGVVHVISNRRDVKGGSASLDDLTQLRANLKTALIGWVPDATNGEAVTFTSGRLLNMDGDGRLWWTDEFQLKDYWSA